MEKIIDKPNLYDLLYCDVVEDIEMYRKLFKDSKSILELGAGTGRVTIPLAKDGHDIEAVDLSKSMLEKLKLVISNDQQLMSRITPVLANMCGYKSTKKHDGILIPLTSFNYLLTEEEQRACLDTIKQNLNDNGFAVVELLSNNTFMETNRENDFVFIKRIKESDNSYYDYYRITELDLDTRVIKQRRLFKYYVDGKYVTEEELEWINRFVTVDDFKKLVESSGLVIDTIYGNCQLEKYYDNSEDVFVKLRGR